MVELFRGRIGSLYRVHYEIVECGLDANATIHALANVIETSRPAVRRAWTSVSLRDFNVGVEVDRGVRSVEHAIDARAVARVAALGGRIVLTAYNVTAMKAATRRRST